MVHYTQEKRDHIQTNHIAYIDILSEKDDYFSDKIFFLKITQLIEYKAIKCIRGKTMGSLVIKKQVPTLKGRVGTSFVY